MKTLVFATNNSYKLKEIRQLLGTAFDIKGLSDIACNEELPENQTTLEGNALEKAAFVYEKYGIECFADDTGLEVEALNGAPGVYSARYAGTNASFADNTKKLLNALKGETNKRAVFKTVIALIYNGEKHFFEGCVEGEIIDKEIGNEGFGYDPVFKPAGFSKTFAEMTPEQKNSISHRAKAIKALVDFFNKQ